jgi:hypothetical protein
VNPSRSILVSIIVLIALAAGIVTFEYGRISRSLYGQAVLTEGRAARDRLHMLISPPLSSLNLTARLLSQSASQDEAAPGLLVLSVLAEEKSLSAATVSDASGVVAMACRAADGFLLFVRTGQTGAAGKWTRLDANMGQAGDAQVPADALQAMGRILAEAAASHAGDWPAWTNAHPVPGVGTVSITALVVSGSDWGTPKTLAFSFGLEDIWRALTLDSPEGARILICTPDGHVLDPAAPGKPQPVPLASSGARAAAPDTLGAASAVAAKPAPAIVPYAMDSDPARSEAVRAWLAAGKPASDAFPFQTGGQSWWASVQPLAGEGSRTFVGLALSREALFGQLFTGGRNLMLAGAGLAVAIGLLAWLAVRSRMRRRFGSTPFFETEQEIRELIGQGESERLEFKSTLRFNLAAGKPGKEIELAVLKTLTAFMNTDGGVLVVGVDDEGRALGLDADGFENDDHALRHFTSIFAQHVGVEHLSGMVFAVRAFDERKILLVECSRSSEPVILKGGKDEEFYVRAGPSSRKLSLSEFMRRVTGKGGAG